MLTRVSSKLFLLLSLVLGISACESDKKVEPVDVQKKLNLPSADQIDMLQNEKKQMQASSQKLIAWVAGNNRLYNFELLERTKITDPDKYKFATHYFANMQFQFESENLSQTKQDSLNTFLIDTAEFFPLDLQEEPEECKIDQKFIDKEFKHEYDDAQNIYALAVTMDYISPGQARKDKVSLYDIVQDSLNSREAISLDLKNKLLYLLQVKHNAHIDLFLKLVGGESTSDGLEWEGDFESLNDSNLDLLSDSVLMAIKTLKFLESNGQSILKYSDRYKKLSEMTLTNYEDVDQKRKTKLLDIKANIKILLDLAHQG